jgi:hypothetical protein
MTISICLIVTIQSNYEPSTNDGANGVFVLPAPYEKVDQQPINQAAG